jgi:hypothetical protein
MTYQHRSPRGLLAATLLVLCAYVQAAPQTLEPAQPGVWVTWKAWKAWKGQLYRLEADGNVSCYSEDGQTCQPGESPGTGARPLTCGADMKTRTGGSGYDQQAHWCNTAYANLFATWRNYQLQGVDLLLSETPEGDLMCGSTDGRSCMPAGEHHARPGKVEFKPLVCGPAMSAALGESGYGPDSQQQWCRTPVEIVSRWTAVTNLFGQGGKEDVDNVGRTRRELFEIELPAWGHRLVGWTVRMKGGVAPRFTLTDHDGRVFRRWEMGSDEGAATIAQLYQVVHPADRWGDVDALWVLKSAGGTAAYAVRAKRPTDEKLRWAMPETAWDTSQTTSGRGRLAVAVDATQSIDPVVEEVTMTILRKRPPGAASESGPWMD